MFLGPSGCGKSTILRMIAGLEEISEGTVSIDGIVVNDLEPRERGVAMVFQNYALYPHMTIRDNIAFGLRRMRVPAAEIDDRIAEAAELLGLKPYLERRPAELSGGQQQRAAIARAIVKTPRVFLFDEPLSNLDAKLRNHMRVEIARLHQRLRTTTDLRDARPARSDDPGRPDRPAQRRPHRAGGHDRKRSTSGRPRSSWPVSSAPRP